MFNTGVPGLVVAIPFCDSQDQHLGLLLHSSPDKLEDPRRPRYRIGWVFRSVVDDVQRFARVVELGKEYENILFFGSKVKIQRNKLYIVDTWPLNMKDKLDPLRRCDELHSIVPTPPFIVPSWIVNHLLSLGLELSNGDVLYTIPTGNNDLLAVLDFADGLPILPNSFRVTLGKCKSSILEYPQISGGSDAMEVDACWVASTTTAVEGGATGLCGTILID